MINANRWTDLDKKIESIKGVIYPNALDVPLQNRLAHLSTIVLVNYENNKAILKIGKKFLRQRQDIIHI